jgi:hypothetical protein
MEYQHSAKLLARSFFAPTFYIRDFSEENLLTISFYITNVRFIRNVATDLQLIIIDISKKLIY